MENHTCFLHDTHNCHMCEFPLLCHIHVTPVSHDCHTCDIYNTCVPGMCHRREISHDFHICGLSLPMYFLTINKFSNFKSHVKHTQIYIYFTTCMCVVWCTRKTCVTTCMLHLTLASFCLIHMRGIFASLRLLYL